MGEGLAEMGRIGEHLHGDTRQLLTSGVHFRSVFRPDVFFIRPYFFAVLVDLDGAYFDDFSLADAARFLLAPSDRVHFKVYEYCVHVSKLLSNLFKLLSAIFIAPIITQDRP